MAEDRAWHEIVRDVLRRHNVSLFTYVPDTSSPAHARAGCGDRADADLRLRRIGDGEDKRRYLHMRGFS
jgi:hypothetical protein